LKFPGGGAIMMPMNRLLSLLLLAAAAGAAGPLNDTCPVSGDRTDGKITAELKIGFCCANCKGRFDRDPLATLRKLDRIPVDVCPLSGKPVADAVSTVTIALCRDECRKSFEKDPGKYLGKLKPAEPR
jgi:YHS domain-containing protein